VAAGNSTQAHLNSPGQHCRQLRNADAAGFKQTYGAGPNKVGAFGRCASAWAQRNRTNISNARPNASRLCRTEQQDSNFSNTTLEPQHNGQTFNQFYGDTNPHNPNANNAFGKCVSQKAKALGDARTATQQAAQVNGFKNAAKYCKDLRANHNAQFLSTYGTSHNAYGKCVARNAKNHS
jgi:hypothetical protein